MIPIKSLPLDVDQASIIGEILSSQGPALHLRFEPGNCTRYEVLFQVHPPEMAKDLGWGPTPLYQLTLANFGGERGVSTLFSGPPMPYELRERLGVLEGDAEVLHELVRALIAAHRAAL